MIRQAKTSDIPAIAEIEWQSFVKEKNVDLKKRIMNVMKECPKGIMVDGKKGYIRGITVSNKHDPYITTQSTGDQQLYIISLAVHSSYRGKGIAGRLVSVLMKRFNLPTFLVVESLNDTPYKIYHALGFRKVKKLPRFFVTASGRMAMGYLLRHYRL